MDESIRQAFQKVKEDIMFLVSELNSTRAEILQTHAKLQELRSELQDLKNTHKSPKNPIPTHKQEIPTHPTHNQTQNPIPTHDMPSEGLKSPNLRVSTGNEGVPTDRQTNRQTVNRHIFSTDSNTPTDKNNEINHLDKAREILDSLDSLKKEVRIKFKKLTEQEMHIFALLYQLEEEGELVDYAMLADKTKLSESSIRDYIRKITKKGIPITKERLNNKRILLHISQDLKKIANLDTILRLRAI